MAEKARVSSDSREEETERKVEGGEEVEVVGGEEGRKRRNHSPML